MRHRSPLAIVLLLAAPWSAAYADGVDGPPPDEKPSETRTAPAPMPPDEIPPEEARPWAYFPADGRLPRGEAVTVPVVVSNPGPDRMSGVKLQLLKASQPTEFLDEVANLGDIAPRSESKGTVRILISEGPECSEEYVLAFTLSWDGGSLDDQQGVIIACPGPRLFQSNIRYVGGDDDGVPEPGERLQVFVTYTNEGVDPATAVRGTITQVSEGTTAEVDEASWPDIAPGASAENREPFVIQIAEDAALVEGCAQQSAPIIVEDDGPVEGGGSDSDPGTVSSSKEEERAAGTGYSLGTPARPEPATQPPDGQDTDPMEEQDPAAALEARLTILSAETSFEDGFGAYAVCALAAEDLPSRATDNQATKERTDEDLLAAGAEDAGGGSSGVPLAAVLGVLAAASLWMARRTMQPS
ncbi:MAG: hypothetical protein ACLGH3_02330 [Actinomycetota bacterium]